MFYQKQHGILKGETPLGSDCLLESKNWQTQETVHEELYQTENCNCGTQQANTWTHFLKNDSLILEKKKRLKYISSLW